MGEQRGADLGGEGRGVFADLRRRSLGRLAIDISNRDFNAASRERVRNSAADALRAPGYERALAVKLRVRRTGRRHHPSTPARASHINKIGGREGAFCLIMLRSTLVCAPRDAKPLNIRRNGSSLSRL